MTIKQQGGIFGRNPTFNEVDATDITTESLSLLKNNPFVRLDDSDTDNNGEFRLDNTSVRIEADKDNAVADSKIKFKIDNSEIGFFDENGNLDIDGNLVVASGQGIDFSATSGTGTSELFDDYEEGTWTPTYVPQTGSFTSLTLKNNNGTYVKIGRKVYLECRISVDGDAGTDLTGASGRIEISGLPFTAEASSSSSGFAGGGFITNTVSNWGISGSTGPQLCQITGTVIRPMFIDDTTANRTVYVDVTDMSSASGTRNSFTFTAQYTAA